MSTVYRQPA